MNKREEQNKKKQMKVNSREKRRVVVDRDVDILSFINNFGFCDIRHLEKEFNLKKRRCYQIVERLINAGLLEHKFVFHKKHGIYQVTAKGAKWTSLSELSSIPDAHYKHQVATVDVYLKLRQLYPDAIWITERQLIFDSQDGKYDHIADGILINKEHDVAIEVELNLKSKKRVEKIVKSYLSQRDIKEVWYFCAEKIFPPMQRLTTKYQQYVKVYNIKEFLA